jgi:hypothetical protein
MHTLRRVLSRTRLLNIVPWWLVSLGVVWFFARRPEKPRLNSALPPGVILCPLIARAIPFERCPQGALCGGSGAMSTQWRAQSRLHIGGQSLSK